MLYDYFQLGGPLMWPLLACSVTSLTVILERSFFWTVRGLFIDRKLRKRVLAALKEGKEFTVDSGTLGNRDPFAKLLHQAVQLPQQEIPDYLRIGYDQERREMLHYMKVLEVIVAVAPLLGIIGTVTGMIVAFDFVGKAGLGDPQSAIGGIAQAFITTAFGLSIAVITLLAHRFFLACIESFSGELRCSINCFALLSGRSPC